MSLFYTVTLNASSSRCEALQFLLPCQKCEDASESLTCV